MSDQDGVLDLGDNFSDLQDDLLGLDDNETDLGLIKSQCGFDQDGNFSEERFLQKSNPARRDIFGEESYHPSSSRMEPCTTVKNMKIPKTFANGSTVSHQNQRYLMWNMFGTIRSFSTPQDSSIEIEFHDATVHPEINIDNAATSYSIGDLNTNIVALASSKNPNRESELMVMHIGAWDSDSRQWNITMPEDEVIECLAVGQDFVAVFTSARYLRIFSAAGIQRNILSLTGSVLTMCAHGSFLAIANLTGGVIITSEEDYEHQVSAEIYEITPLSSSSNINLLRTVPVALSRASHLKWICFSDAGRLVTMDNECVVRLCSSDNFWLPIFTGTSLLRNSESDFIWPIAVAEKPSAVFRYVYCKGTKYPIVSKNLVPLSVPWSLPVVNSAAERSSLECQVMLNELMQTSGNLLTNNKALSATVLTTEIARLKQENLKNLVKLFAISCKSGRECRAAELANLTSDSHGIQVLCTYAAKSQRPNLAEKVASIGRNRIPSAVEEKDRFAELSDVASQSSLFSSSQIFASVENQLAPNNQFLPKRKLVQQRPAKRLTSQDSDVHSILDRTVSQDTEETRTNADSTCDSFDANIFASPSQNNSDIIPAKNPFKRMKTLEYTKKVDDIYSGGVDFFEQLSNKRLKSD